MTNTRSPPLTFVKGLATHALKSIWKYPQICCLCSQKFRYSFSVGIFKAWAGLQLSKEGWSQEAECGPDLPMACLRLSFSVSGGPQERSLSSYPKRDFSFPSSKSQVARDWGPKHGAKDEVHVCVHGYACVLVCWGEEKRGGASGIQGDTSLWVQIRRTWKKWLVLCLPGSRTAKSTVLSSHFHFHLKLSEPVVPNSWSTYPWRSWRNSKKCVEA